MKKENAQYTYVLINNLYRTHYHHHQHYGIARIKNNVCTRSVYTHYNQFNRTKQ